ncbi:hypothetical protein Scep_025465 [Stephania cephalantha]|uniref:CCHC-type domain-containing protein n=1 Tax=Stephania cephalantha TaxID=152367 RepID=A0AAP0EIA0_9MAGN
MSKVAAWIRLPDLPYQYYHSQIVADISNLVGRTIKVDMNTITGKRGKFARVAVELDLAKPLIPMVRFHDLWQIIEYEGLPPICFTCGRTGHSFASCPQRAKPNNENEASTSNATPSTPKHQNKEKCGQKEGGYGPWMVAQRKRRRFFHELIGRVDQYEKIESSSASRAGACGIEGTKGSSKMRLLGCKDKRKVSINGLDQSRGGSNSIAMLRSQPQLWRAYFGTQRENVWEATRLELGDVHHRGESRILSRPGLDLNTNIKERRLSKQQRQRWYVVACGGPKVRKNNGDGQWRRDLRAARAATSKHSLVLSNEGLCMRASTWYQSYDSKCWRSGSRKPDPWSPVMLVKVRYEVSDSLLQDQEEKTQDLVVLPLVYRSGEEIAKSEEKAERSSVETTRSGRKVERSGGEITGSEVKAADLEERRDR